MERIRFLLFFSLCAYVYICYFVIFRFVSILVAAIVFRYLGDLCKGVVSFCCFGCANGAWIFGLVRGLLLCS